jgi:hypothetical protein
LSSDDPTPYLAAVAAAYRDLVDGDPSRQPGRDRIDRHRRLTAHFAEQRARSLADDRSTP